jgi:hypothetical protein
VSAFDSRTGISTGQQNNYFCPIIAICAVEPDGSAAVRMKYHLRVAAFHVVGTNANRPSSAHSTLGPERRTETTTTTRYFNDDENASHADDMGRRHPIDRIGDKAGNTWARGRVPAIAGFDEALPLE